LPCNADCDACSICDDHNLLRSKRVLPPDWGARGARLFRGQASFGDVSIGSETSALSFASSLRTLRGCRPSPWSRSVRSSFGGGAQTLISCLGAETLCPQGEVVRWKEARTRWVSLRQRCPRPWRPKGPSVCSDSGQGREQRKCQDHGSATSTAPSVSEDQPQPARGRCPHPFSAPIAGERAAADPSPVPLPHGG